MKKTAAKNAPRVIGLTGGIGSGKTVATDALSAAGYLVIDADEISRELFGRGTAGEKALTELFPFSADGDALDRKKLRAAISDRTMARRLNEYTHPIIEKEVKKRLSRAANGAVLSAPLLLESGLGALCDKVVCVYCPKSRRAERVAARDGISLSDAEKLIDAQIPDTLRCTVSDHIVSSDRDEKDFEREIVKLFDSLTNK